ncbi:MAG: M48 family metalloprotease, partial [Candidatus Hadarchaeum sp.]
IPKHFLAVFSKDELRCIFLHEVAHVKRRHFLKDAVFALTLLSLALALSWNSVLIFLPSVFVAAVLTLSFHRRFEYEADKFAAERVSAGAMVGVLRELRRRYGEKGLVYRISHPSIEQRIRRLGHD